MFFGMTPNIPQEEDEPDVALVRCAACGCVYLERCSKGHAVIPIRVGKSTGDRTYEDVG
jgi:hypothetical protein